jgi:hypothetical protein
MDIMIHQIEHVYKTTLPNDYSMNKDASKDASEVKESEKVKLIPEDLRILFSKYKTFRLGLFDFALRDVCRCKRLGPYIEVGQAYCGQGVYSTWCYYIDLNKYGRRTDDNPEFRLMLHYDSFTELVCDFLRNVHLYDCKNGRIVARVRNLPLL